MDSVVRPSAFRRLLVIGLALGFAVAFVGAVIVGNRRANREVARLHAAAAVAKVDTAGLAAALFKGSAPNPVAVALDVPSHDVALSNRSGRWCAQVEVRRLLAERDIRFRLENNGTLHSVDRCG